MAFRFRRIHDMAVSFRKIDLDKITEKVLKARKFEISELNRGQLQRGQRPDGSFLPPYSPASVAMGKPAGRVRLKDKGYYYAGLVPEFANSSFMVNATDIKSDMLQSEYGVTAGLTTQSIGELAQDSLGQIQYELRKAI